MIFDHLLNESRTELDLLRLVAEQVFAHFHDQQNWTYYLKLQKTGEGLSKIIWVKAFDDYNEYLDFHYSFRFKQARIFAYLARNNYYRVQVSGFWAGTWADVYQDRIEYFRTNFTVSPDCESFRAISREVIEAGMADLLGQFRANAKKAS